MNTTITKESAILPLLLKQLRLNTMATHWEEIADQAESNHWPYAKFLAKLADLEACDKKQRRIQRYIHEAKLPIGKTLDTFNFKEAQSVNAARIRALAENADWVNKASNLVIFGPSGVGKTHLAAAITYKLIEQGIRALFTSTTALVQKLQLAYQECRLPEMLARLSRYPLLVLDDIGYVKKSEHETSVLFELIADRYESSSIIITSNQSFGDWDKIFPDGVTAVAAIDRLVHHSTIINITDESYRKRKSVKNSHIGD